jgi:hypothetical protein
MVSVPSGTEIGGRKSSLNEKQIQKILRRVPKSKRFISIEESISL